MEIRLLMCCVDLQDVPFCLEAERAAEEGGEREALFQLKSIHVHLSPYSRLFTSINSRPFMYVRTSICEIFTCIYGMLTSI